MAYQKYKKKTTFDIKIDREYVRLRGKNHPNFHKSRKDNPKL